MRAFLVFLCWGFKVYSSIIVDPQREESNLQNEQSKGIQMTEDLNLQQEGSKGVEFGDRNLQQERTNDLQYREDLNMKQEKDLNRIF